MLSYVRSEKGCVLPFGYTAQFMNQFACDDLPDLKMLLWSTTLIRHGRLTLVACEIAPDDRRDLFQREAKLRRAARRSEGA